MKKILITIILSILLMSSSLAVDQYMLGDLRGRNTYKIYDIISVTASNLYGTLNASYISNAPWITGYTETDPIYSAWDKDYNDLTNRPNLSVYNDSAAIALKLDITDQRYNDTTAINLKLTATDQRYNESSLISAVNTSLASQTTLQSLNNQTQAGIITGVDGRVTALNSSKAQIGSSAACTYGVANITLSATGVPTVTCAAAQGDITGVTATAPGLTGGGTSGAITVGLNSTYINSLWNNTAAVNVVDGRVTAVNSSLQSAISLQAANNQTQGTLISNLDARESANNVTQNTLIGLRLLTSTFTTENSSIWTAIGLRLLATDQRYNDTAAIALKLDITDQRYNESSKVSSVNQSLTDYFNRVDCSGENVFLFGQDETYNYCKSVNASALGVTITETDPVFVSNNASLWSGINAKASPGTCPSGQVVQNTTTSGVQCVTVSATGNPFNQVLNTTSNVTFNRINVTIICLNAACSSNITQA